MPAVLNVEFTVVADVEVDGVPPLIVHRTESGEPTLAVDVFVNVKLEPIHTVLSLIVKLAVAVGMYYIMDVNQMQPFDQLHYLNFLVLQRNPFLFVQTQTKFRIYQHNHIK